MRTQSLSVVVKRKLIGSVKLPMRTGTLMIAPASPAGFAPTASAKILDGKCWAAPVLAHGLIYCRNTRGAVVVVDVRKK